MKIFCDTRIFWLAAAVAAAITLIPVGASAEIPASAQSGRPMTGTHASRPSQSGHAQASRPSQSDDKDSSYRPSANQGYRPSTNQGYRPSANQGYRPNGNSVYRPAGQSRPAPSVGNRPNPAPANRPNPGYKPAPTYTPGHHAYVPSPAYRPTPNYARPLPPPAYHPRPNVWYDYDYVYTVPAYRPTVVVTVPSAPYDTYDDMIVYENSASEDAFAGAYESGCADGGREGFLDYALNPDIAGCSGAWSIPGIHHDEGPACGRNSGNTSNNPDGQGCNVEDLCAEGWHVCRGIQDVIQHSPTGCTNVMEGQVTPAFFVTRETSDGALMCRGDGYSRPALTNDLFGCGDLGCGLGPEKGCSVLTRSSHDGCLGISSSYHCDCDSDGTNITCSGDQGCNWCRPVDYYNTRDNTVYPEAWQCRGRGNTEALDVTKVSPELGGVLCCRN